MCPRKIFGLAIVALVTLGGRVAAYTNQWAVHIEGGAEVAKQVAREHGFQYLDKVGAYPAFLPRNTFRGNSKIMEAIRHAIY